LYERLFVGNKINDSRLKYKGSEDNKQYELFISDHFGVLTKFHKLCRIF
jgi:hypothetical protein